MTNIVSLPWSPKARSNWCNSLVNWFEREGKKYPWRLTVDPYKILVSETMLQQTQIASVINKKYYENWLEKFPNIEALVRADEAELLKAWEGLGYYNRVRNLQKAAQMVIEQFSGEFPEHLNELLKLPGVGPYTAGAIRSFSFNLSAPIVDGNVIRILTRVFDYHNPVDVTDGKKQIWRWAEEMTDSSRPRLYNSAIMELGQQVCRKTNPSCHICPVAKSCAISGDLAAAKVLPVKSKKTRVTQKKETVVCLIRGNQILLVKEAGSRRVGLWRLPLWNQDTDSFELLTTLSYAITRFKVELSVYSPVADQFDKVANKIEGKWFDLSAGLPALGAPYQRAIREILGYG